MLGTRFVHGRLDGRRGVRELVENDETARGILRPREQVARGPLGPVRLLVHFRQADDVDRGHLGEADVLEADRRTEVSGQEFGRLARAGGLAGPGWAYHEQ